MKSYAFNKKEGPGGKVEVYFLRKKEVWDFFFDHFLGWMREEGYSEQADYLMAQLKACSEGGLPPMELLRNLGRRSRVGEISLETGNFKIYCFRHPRSPKLFVFNGDHPEYKTPLSREKRAEMIDYLKRKKYK